MVRFYRVRFTRSSLVFLVDEDAQTLDGVPVGDIRGRLWRMAAERGVVQELRCGVWSSVPRQLEFGA